MFVRPLLAAAAITLFAGAAAAQPAPTSQRVTGQVKSVTATDLVLATPTGDVDIALTAKTRVVARQSAATAEIKPGSYLGTSNQTNAAGSGGTATEVHLMDGGPNVHYPMNGEGLMMTNGHVKSVTDTSKGKEIEIDYGQASTRHVVVTSDTSMTRMIDVGVAGLKTGVPATAMTQAGEGGKATAMFVLIGGDLP